MVTMNCYHHSFDFKVFELNLLQKLFWHNYSSIVEKEHKYIQPTIVT